METSTVPQFPNPVVKRRWTKDPMENVLLLPEELIEEILFELAQCEIDNIRRVPTGLFTWYPHLIGIDTEFCRRYTEIFELCLQAQTTLCRECEHDPESEDGIPLNAEVFLSTFALCEPRVTEGVTGCMCRNDVRQNYLRQKFGECPNAGRGHPYINGCLCAGRGRRENKLYLFGRTAAGTSMTIYDISLVKLLIDRPVRRGLTHLWMSETIGPVADLKEWKICPCCATSDGIRTQPVMLASTLIRGDLTEARQAVSARHADAKQSALQHDSTD